MKKLKIALRQFFSSLWEDFANLVKKHFFRLLGFISMFVVPVIVLLTTYVEKVEGKTKWVIPFAVIIPLAILLLIYWGKLRRYLSTKINAMKIENHIEKGKHAGAIIVCDTIQCLMTILPFALVYILIKELEKYTAQLSNIFLFMIVCESVGSLFVIIDTIRNVIDYSEEELKELEEEIKN